MARIAQNRAGIEAHGTQVAFVHMNTEKEAVKFFQKYNLSDAARIEDKDQKLYRAFPLGRATFWQMFGPASMLKVLKTAFLKHYGMGGLGGDEFLLPGAFLLRNGQVLKSHLYKEPWDHPDFLSLSAL